MSDYRLPFRKDTRLWCTQGNNNTAPGASHAPGSKAAYAFDFSTAPGNADEGEPLVAAAAGVVAMIREDTPDDVTGWAGRGRGNYLVISHGDGTCDIYMHLKHNSVSEFGLTVGTEVARGQTIARLGKTGFCFGAHVHLQKQTCGAANCTIPCPNNYWQQSIPTSFSDVPGDGVPRQGQSYVSGNEEAQPATLEETLEAITAQRVEAVLKPAQALAAISQHENLGAPLSAVSMLAAPDGQTFYVQIFEGDTLYIKAAPPIQEENVRHLGSLLAGNPADSWGLALWGHTYGRAGLTYQPRWASHQYVLNQLATDPLGTPLGGGVTNGVHMQFIDGKRYEAEVYARDTIYWIAGVWGDIHRMSKLLQRTPLQQWLQSITTQRADAVLKVPRVLSAFAQHENLGAPFSPVSQISAPDGRQFYVQVYETDTIYVSTTPPIEEEGVGRMRTRLIGDPSDDWGLALWTHTYANAGLTFQAHWASHLYVLNQLATNPLGAPLDGGDTNGVFRRFVEGRQHEMEVYARDTIYWVPPAWGTILRMSDLP